jgi:hypothetical protein
MQLTHRPWKRVSNSTDDFRFFLTVISPILIGEVTVTGLLVDTRDINININVYGINQ